MNTIGTNVLAARSSVVATDSDTAPSKGRSWQTATRFLLIFIVFAILSSLKLNAQSATRGLAISLNSVTVRDEDDDFDADEPYLIVTQFRFRVASGSGLAIVPGTLEVANVTGRHGNLHNGTDWASEGSTPHAFGPIFAADHFPANEANWVLGAVVLHMEEDGFSQEMVDLMAARMNDEVFLALSRATIPNTEMVRTLVIGRIAEQIVGGIVRFNGGNILEGLEAAIFPDDFGGIGLAMVVTQPGNNTLMFARRLNPTDTATTIAAGLTPATATRSFTFDFPFGDGHHVINGTAPTLFPADWTQTLASGMGDVAVGRNGLVGLAGLNGTIWTTWDGEDFIPTSASGMQSVGVADNGTVFAVGGNGSLWNLATWNPVLVAGSGVTDVANFGPATLWIARRSRIALSTWGGGFSDLLTIANIRRLAADPFNRVWAVRTDGALFKQNGSTWTMSIGPQSNTNSGVEDVTAGGDGRVWVVRRDGTIWMSRDGATYNQVLAGGFRRIAVGPDNRIWAVGTNGTLWHFDGNQL